MCVVSSSAAGARRNEEGAEERGERERERERGGGEREKRESAGKRVCARIYIISVMLDTSLVRAFALGLGLGHLR